MKIKEENSRILNRLRIHWSQAKIRRSGSGSVSQCHGSTTLVFCNSCCCENSRCHSLSSISQILLANHFYQDNSKTLNFLFSNNPRTSEVMKKLVRTKAQFLNCDTVSPPPPPPPLVAVDREQNKVLCSVSKYNTVPLSTYVKTTGTVTLLDPVAIFICC